MTLRLGEFPGEEGSTIIVHRGKLKFAFFIFACAIDMLGFEVGSLRVRPHITRVVENRIVGEKSLFNISEQCMDDNILIDTLVLQPCMPSRALSLCALPMQCKRKYNLTPKAMQKEKDQVIKTKQGYNNSNHCGNCQISIRSPSKLTAKSLFFFQRRVPPHLFHDLVLRLHDDRSLTASQANEPPHLAPLVGDCEARGWPLNRAGVRHSQLAGKALVVEFGQLVELPLRQEPKVEDCTGEGRVYRTR